MPTRCAAARAAARQATGSLVNTKKILRRGNWPVHRCEWFCRTIVVKGDMVGRHGNRREDNTTTVRNWMRPKLLHLCRSRQDDAV
jgi:hypothetical protein